MTEKKVEVPNKFQNERFEFSLTINGYIICQRSFKIHGFNELVKYSIEIVESIDKCVKLIDDDLKSKTLMYLDYTAPQYFPSKDAMDKWVETTTAAVEAGVASPTFSIKPFTYVMVKNDSNEEENACYIWDGESMTPYEKNFNDNDFYVKEYDKSVLKFAFYDNGKEVCSKCWSTSCYPKFIRSNIDLSNSKNKYDNMQMPEKLYFLFELYMIKCFNETHKDIIPLIVKELCNCCSKKKYYTTEVEYGGKVYDLNMQNYIPFSGYFKTLKKKKKN